MDSLSKKRIGLWFAAMSIAAGSVLMLMSACKKPKSEIKKIVKSRAKKAKAFA